MRIIDILNSPWAIHPQKLNEIKSIYQTHLRGEKIDWKAIESKLSIGRTEEIPPPYQVINGVAVINISGVLMKSMSFMSWLFGGSSMQAIGDAYRAAIADNSVKAIMLKIDSPGGTVDGTQELAGSISNGKAGKPVIAYSDGQMTSAAYWIGSSADALYISGDTVVTGSIGVIATHIDVSKNDEQYGERYTLITAGKYKGVTSIHAPLSAEGRQELQDMVDHIYGVFISDVARNRNISIEDALKMADGKIFIGKQAVEVGLVDGVATYDQLINSMSAGEPITSFRAEEENQAMDLKELKAKHPEIYQEAVQVGASEAQTAISAQMQARVGEGIIYGAAIENERIRAIQALSIPGHEKIIDAAIKDPKVTAAEVAVQIVQAEKKVGANALKDAAADAAAAAAIAAPAAPVVQPPEANDDNLTVEEKCKKEWEASAELRSEFAMGGLPAYTAFKKNEANIRIKK